MPATALVAPLLVLLGIQPLHAQGADSGTVVVTVKESMGMVDGFLVRSDGRNATTDAGGRARLVLPTGPRTLDVTRIGFVPKRVSVMVIADSTTSVTIDVEMQGMAMEEVAVTATRIERLAGRTPLRVEVLDQMEVDENMLMAPSGITMLLNETPGLRVHHASPTLGTGSVRILGLSGQYTALLADGLPLYGGAASALGPLDISPVDLSRVELIKGAASSLYGGQALGGVINMISKAPSGRNEILLNRRTMGVTDAATWLSRRFSEHSGVSLLLSGTMQDAADPDDDGWGDQSRARRWGLRPRYSFNDRRGRSLFVTAGYGYDDRQGGTLGGARTPAGLPFRAAQQEASRRLLLLSLLALVGIFIILHADFGTVRLATLVFASLPFALVGGIIAVWITGGTLSLGSLVGFVTVLGIAARNGIMLVSHYRHLEHEEGVPFDRDLVLRGVEERLAPILMTALVTALALLPLVIWGDRPGHEIEHPMAIVILGGLASSTLLNLFLMPALYLRYGRRR